MESKFDLDWKIQQNLQYPDLEKAYLDWAAVNKKHLDAVYLLLKNQKEPSPDEKKESLKNKEARDTLFSNFLALFRERLQEIKHQLTIEHSRSLPVDISGVTRPYVSQLVDIAFDLKIHARLMNGKLEFYCSQDPNLQKLDLTSVPSDDLAIIGATKDNNTGDNAECGDHENRDEDATDPGKITKDMIAEFSDLPDPIEHVEVEEILPSENKIKFKITEPDSYNSPLLGYSALVEMITIEGEALSTEFELSVKEPTFETPLLLKLKSLVISFTAENHIGRQQKPFILKLQFATPYNEIWMFGRNDSNQIEYQLVDQVGKDSIDKHEKEDLYCGAWSQITFDSMGVKDLKPIFGVCKTTTLCIVNNSQLVQWGMTLTQQENKVETIPADMFVRSGILVNSVSIGNTFCSATTIDGRVFTWGDNRVGQLGQGNFSPLVEHPTLVAALVGHFITDIKSGFGHCLCLSDKGVAFSWGMKQAIVGSPVLNRFGDHISFENLGIHQHTPQDISTKYIEAGEKVKSIATGEFHLSMVTDKGKLFLWGENEFSMFGEYSHTNSVLPIRIPLSAPVISFSPGFSHNIVEIKSDSDKKSTYLGWGSNEHFECGVSSQKNIREPLEVEAFQNLNVKSFSCGVDRTFIIDNEDNLYLIGKKFRGLTDKRTVVPIKIKEKVKAVQELNGTIVALN
jgi:alpha-tubulin suppressor-like RCC1 family protein